MFRRYVLFVFLIALLLNLYGCAVLIAGAAGGAGTAFWLTGKLTEEVGAPIDKAMEATESAMNSLGLNVVKQTIKDDTAQFIGKYTDERTIWVDLHRISDTVTRVEVRVGAFKRNKAAAKEILNEINIHLKKKKSIR